MKYYFIFLCLLANMLSAAEFVYTENDNTGNNVALGYPVPLPIDSLTPIDGFRTYSSLNLRHHQLVEQVSWLTALNLGTTFNERTIWGYQLSDADNITISGAIEGSALINGGIHAREWQSPEALTGYMENLFAGRNNQHIEQYIIDNLNLVLIPVLNIDGLLQTQRYSNTVTNSINSPRDGRMRRKNMRSVDELLTTTSDNLHGIDLNRNNNPYWATSSEGSSDDNISLVYHGTSAASEPEIQALQNGAVSAGETRLRFYIDTHSFSQIYFTPMTGDQRRDNITSELANIMRAANSSKYRYGPFSAGSGIGATDEYFANSYQIPSYTLEIEPLNSSADYGGNGISHDGFILPASEVGRMRSETSNATFAGLYSIAEKPMLQEIMIKQGGELIFHQQWQVSETGRNLITLVENPLIGNIAYQLIATFNKPMRQLENNQVIGFASLSSPTSINMDWLVSTTNGEQLHSIDTAQGTWLTQGFKHYLTDSYLVDFTLPTDFDWATTSLMALSIQTTDMTGQALDSNPATISDWQTGHWHNYEDSEGNLSDSGGIDKSMRLIDDGSDLYAIAPVPTPLPPIEPTPADSSSGGSISLFGFLMLLLSSQIRWFNFNNK